jgi:hypothetical protein
VTEERNKRHSSREGRSHSSFKKLKHLEVNLMKKLKDLYNENYKSLNKQFNGEFEDGRTSYAHGWAESIL